MARQFGSVASALPAPAQTSLFLTEHSGDTCRQRGVPVMPQQTLDPSFRVMASTGQMIGGFVAAHDKMTRGNIL